MHSSIVKNNNKKKFNKRADELEKFSRKLVANMYGPRRDHV